MAEVQAQTLTVNPITAGLWAQKVYRLGTARLTAREGWTGLVVPTEYYIPVQQYAASRYTTEQLDNALTNGWITTTEYN